MLSLCSTVAMSVLLGPEFSMDTSLIQTIMKYNTAIMPSCAERTSYPRILRPFVWRLSPLCRAMQSNLSKAKMKLIPEIKHRIGIARSKKGWIENGGPMSLLDGLIEMAFEKGSLSRSSDRGDDAQQVHLLAEEIMLYHFELSSPIAFFITFNLYVIMNHKEYLAPLREEISEASKLSGGSLTLDTLKHAPKLESFVKETCRLYDISCCKFFHLHSTLHLIIFILSSNCPGSNSFSSNQFPPRHETSAPGVYKFISKPRHDNYVTW